MLKVLCVSLIMTSFLLGESQEVKSIVESLTKGNFKERKETLKKVSQLSEEEKKSLKKILTESKDPELKKVLESCFPKKEKADKLKSPFSPQAKMFFENFEKKGVIERINFISFCLKNETLPLKERIKIISKFKRGKVLAEFLNMTEDKADNNLITSFYLNNYNVSVEQLADIKIFFREQSHYLHYKKGERIAITATAVQHKKITALNNFLEE